MFRVRRLSARFEFTIRNCPGFNRSKAVIVLATMASHSCRRSELTVLLVSGGTQIVIRFSASSTSPPGFGSCAAALARDLEASSVQSPSGEHKRCPTACENDDGPAGLPSSPRAGPCGSRAANSWRFLSTNPDGRCRPTAHRRAGGSRFSSWTC